MAGLAISEVTILQLIAMGDGLVEAGQYGFAKQIYGLAMKRMPPGANLEPLRAREGLASAPNLRTKMGLGLLRAMEGENLARPFVTDGMATWMKTLPWADDERFLSLADKHAHLLPIPNWQWNLKIVLWAVERCRHVEGDFVELGVFKGHTSLFCAEYADFQDWPKRWWLYDTFEGIPADQQDAGWAKINEELYQGTYSMEEVQLRFAEFSNFKIVKGRVPEVFAETAPEKIAFIHIDLNNAPAEISALDALFDRLSSGGVIVFDDYCWVNARAQYDAENAWFAQRGLAILPLPTGQGVFLKP